MSDEKDPANMTPAELEAAGSKPEQTPEEKAAADTAAAAEAAGKKDPEGKKDEDDPGVLKTRLADTQRMAHEATTKAAELERELQRIREEKDAQEEPKPPEMPSEDELKEMVTSDPTRYAQLIADQKVYEVRKSIWDEKQATKAESKKTEQAQTIVRKTAEEFVNFAAETLQVKGADPKKSFAEQPKEIQEFYESPEFQKVRQYFKSHPALVNADGIVDKETMKMVFGIVNPGYEAPGAAAARERQKSIDEAGASGSKLTGVGGDRSGPGLKPIDKLSLREIVNMKPQDSEPYLAMVEE